MTNPERVRELNDKFRQSLVGGRVNATAGLATRPDFPLILQRVRAFDEFDHSNDPYAEHDFGAFTYEGDQIFFKIDYYNCDLNAGSPDPADPSVTTRVLTIMLAEEY